MIGNWLQAGKGPAKTVRRAALMGAALLCATPWCAMAQPTAATLPGAVQPGRNDRPAPAPLTQPDFDFSIEAPSRSPVGRAVDQVTFVLKDLKITGAQTLPVESFGLKPTVCRASTVMCSWVSVAKPCAVAITLYSPGMSGEMR